MSASPEQNNSVQGILHDSLTSVGFEPVTLPVSDKNIIGSNLSKMDQNGSNWIFHQSKNATIKSCHIYRKGKNDCFVFDFFE